MERSNTKNKLVRTLNVIKKFSSREYLLIDVKYMVYSFHYTPVAIAYSSWFVLFLIQKIPLYQRNQSLRVMFMSIHYNPITYKNEHACRLYVWWVLAAPGGYGVHFVRWWISAHTLRAVLIQFTLCVNYDAWTYCACKYLWVGAEKAFEMQNKF